MALQAPGEHHLGAMLCRNFESQCCLGLHLVTQVEHLRLRSRRLDRAVEPQNLQVLILALQEKFRLCCCPLGICRNSNSSKGLQDFSNAQEDLVRAEGFSVHSPDQAPTRVLKENHSHLAPQGLSLVAPILFPCQGLVLGDVEDHRGFA